MPITELYNNKMKKNKLNKTSFLYYGYIDILQYLHKYD